MVQDFVHQPYPTVEKGTSSIMFIKWEVIFYCQSGLDFASNPCRLCQSFGYPKDSLREVCANSLEKWKAMWAIASTTKSTCIYLTTRSICEHIYTHQPSVPWFFKSPQLCVCVCVTPFVVNYGEFVGSSHCRFWRGWELWTHEPAMLGMNLRDETSYPPYVGITLRWTNIAMGNPPFEDVSPNKTGGFPLLC